MVWRAGPGPFCGQQAEWQQCYGLWTAAAIGNVSSQAFMSQSPESIGQGPGIGDGMK